MVLYGEVLREFQKQKVRYVLVGGMAVNLLGFQRSTADMDILVEMKGTNIAKVVKILKKQGYRVKQPVDPAGLADSKTRNRWIKSKNLKAFNFYKEKEMKEVDIIVDAPVSYEIAKKRAVYFESGDIKLPVVSVKDLIKMKKGSGRDIDKMDVRMLKKVQKIGIKI
jgi:hypothetical protein